MEKMRESMESIGHAEEDVAYWSGYRAAKEGQPCEEVENGYYVSGYYAAKMSFERGGNMAYREGLRHARDGRRCERRDDGAYVLGYHEGMMDYYMRKDLDI